MEGNLQMNDITMKPLGPLGAVSKYFATSTIQNDLGGGIKTSYGIVTFKGKVWTLNYRGESKSLMRKDGDGPVGNIEAVIVKAPAHLSKTYYEAGYTEGASSAPDCFSSNGVVPDPSSKKLQNNVCATCKQNVWGSKVTQQGSKGKACSDNKRLAVVPLSDIDNVEWGGPMLLRVPPTSLQELAAFGASLQKYGYPYCAVGTKISFDPNVPYPKFNFQAMRPLTDDEAQKVIALQGDERVSRILEEAGNGSAVEAPVAPVGSPFEQPPVAAPVAPRPQPAPVVNVVPIPQVVVTNGGAHPAEQEAPPVFDMPESAGSELEDELDSRLHDLLPR